MKLEIGDRLWFGDSDDGMTNSVVVEHLLLDEEQSKKLCQIFPDVEGIKKVDALIFLREDKKRH